MKPGIDFAAELNERQLQVVTADDGPVLAIAAAGTGKTRALTYRVAYLAEERRVDPRRILLLTFTNKAAREMLDRAHDLVGEGVGGLWGGTFHHMANRLLRRHGDRLGYARDYTILDQDDAKSLIRSAMGELKLIGKDFPKPEVLGGIFGLAANTARDVASLAAERFEDHPFIQADDVERVHQRYTAKKRRLNAMDFDDLLTNSLQLFKEDTLLLARYQEHFQYILVDEYQDTNIIQSGWVDLLALGHRNVLAVGDDFQSIYSWRGANFRNIMSFPERYPDTKVIKLEVNYRSVPEVLAVANACIAGNPEQYQKTLVAIREPHRKPFLVRLRDGSEQARFILAGIRQLRQGGRRLDDIAVLYRAHFHAMELQLELTREGIPYVITSGVRFFEQAHIKDVCAIPRLLVQPADELAFSRLLCMFPRLGKKTAAKVWERMGGHFPSDPSTLAGVQDLLPAGSRESWQRVVDIFTDYKKDHLDEDPGEIIYRFVQRFYDAYAVQTFDNYAQRMEDIQELIAFGSRYETTDDFVGEIALLTNVDTTFGSRREETKDCLRLSTVHQAKGLEWGSVFILWLTDGMFPSMRSLNESSGGEAEERRLFYVSTTRAKDDLYLCVPEVRRARDGGVNFQVPSRFLIELPPHLLQREELSVY